VLHDVERGVIVLHRVHGLFEGAPLHGSEEGGELLLGGQVRPSRGGRLGVLISPNGNKPAPRARGPLALNAPQHFGLTNARPAANVDGSPWEKRPIVKALAMELQLPPLAQTGETLTGAEITIRCLQEEGVEYVFGYPGGAVLFIYDAIFKQKKL